MLCDETLFSLNKLQNWCWLQGETFHLNFTFTSLLCLIAVMIIELKYLRWGPTVSLRCHLDAFQCWIPVLWPVVPSQKSTLCSMCGILWHPGRTWLMAHFFGEVTLLSQWSLVWVRNCLSRQYQKEGTIFKQRALFLNYIDWLITCWCKNTNYSQCLRCRVIVHALVQGNQCIDKVMHI